MKSIIILSSKSSGSTALQNYFKENFGYRTVAYTKHQEEETLYWTKVASVLGLKQNKLYRSEVPIDAKKAVKELNEFFTKNNLQVKCNHNTTEEEFQDFYFLLIQKTGNKFIEKSPHHLFNPSNLQLILNFKNAYEDKLDIVIIGLVRHPQSVIYSAWMRWRNIPRLFEKEWLISYKNLLEWKLKLGTKIIRYEDLVTNEIDPSLLIGEKLSCKSDFKFNTKSVAKWKKDDQYRFNVSQKVKMIAQKYGYIDFDKKKSVRWDILQQYYWFLYFAKNFVRKLKK